MIKTAISVVLNFIGSIKWTPLKISIVLNIILLGIVVYTVRTGKGSITTRPTFVVVDVPSKIGTFKPITTFIPIANKKVDTTNSNLLKKYLKLKDSVAQLELFKEVIEENDYKEVYEDSIQKIVVSTKVQGKLLKQSLNYLIKEHKVSVPLPQVYKPIIRADVGLFTYIPINNYEKIDLGLQLSLSTKRYRYSVGYTSNKALLLGISTRLFEL
jgi:hypothetical protein